MECIAKELDRSITVFERGLASGVEVQRLRVKGFEVGSLVRVEVLGRGVFLVAVHFYLEANFYFENKI